MNLGALLGVKDGDGPSGENLEYDSDFIQMEIAATPGQERQAGEEILAAEDPDFADVQAKALAIMERSHDLRAGAVLAGALLNIQGLTGLAEATEYCRRCLEEFWDSCHPQLDADDDNDPTMRVNAVRGLAASGTMLRWLRKVPLTKSRAFGRISLRDIQIATGEVQPADGETGPDRASVRAAFEDTDAEFLAAQLAAAKATVANIKAIDAKFRAETPGFGPDLDELAKMVQQVIRHMSEYVVAPAGAEPEVEDEGAQEAVAAAAPVRRTSGGAPGAIETQRDVTAALDAIISYYRRAEPSSPIPIVLERAKRMVGADFMSIVKDMAPKGLENVMLIGGIDD
jgi:type VI secretion system protein ImpA